MRIAAVLLVLAAELPAHAHHPSSSAPYTARSDVRLEAGATWFDMEGHHGHYETIALAGDWRFVDGLAAGARVPFHILDVEGDDTVTGIGDVGALVTWQFLDRHEASLAAVLTGELPTGDDESGIGSGHFELSGGVVGQYRLGVVSLEGALSYVQSLGGHEHDETGAEHHHQFVDPHDERQLEIGAGVSYTPEHWFAGIGLHAEVPFVEHEGADVRLVAGASGGTRLAGIDWRLVAAAGLNDDRPYDVRAVLIAELRLGHH